ncbi:hypothetical protein K6Y31_06350 [Motilimonas cestriensis]|uniref:Uncharacterized protein n=1 Tax=Motilimonas cestriensis TaxID=2742685 RepID=A0ABS8WA17_9GAMM|nr:hypothetical protein [Motilimonas cestriensis]MCE2594431.1 hypothetical protein [Motilimonas cestriensis]
MLNPTTKAAVDTAFTRLICRSVTTHEVNAVLSLCGELSQLATRAEQQGWLALAEEMTLWRDQLSRDALRSTEQ